LEQLKRNTIGFVEVDRPRVLVGAKGHPIWCGLELNTQRREPPMLGKDVAA